MTMFDLRALPDSYYDDPYPVYRALRDEAPILPLADGTVFVTGYEPARDIYRDPRRFSSDKRLQFGPVFGVDTPLYAHHTTSLVFNDPPLHTRVRRAIGNALSEKVVRDMEVSLIGIVDGLLERIAARKSRQFDLIADFASAIPVQIISDLLCVPVAAREPLRRWSLAILGALEVGLDERARALGNRSVEEFLEYLQTFVPERAAALEPEDDDILARLLRWTDGGEALSAHELYHQCIFLLNAGHETTTNLIANGIVTLLNAPQALKTLLDSPEYIGTAVEEVLRFESPNQLGNRTVTEDLQLAGVSLRQGTVIVLCIGAANRDPAVFTDPDRFDITRSPNPHLAFGSGIHTCAGLNVARLEGRIAISRLLERFPDVRLAGHPVRSRRARFRGFDAVPLAF